LSYGLSPLHLLELGRDFRPKGERRRLIDQDGLSLFPACIDDGREIIFSLGTSVETAVLHRFSVTESTGAQPLGFGGRGAVLPAFSHQRRRLAFSQLIMDRNIYRVALKDLNVTSDVADLEPVKFIASTRDDRNAQYSPDGRRIAFSSERTGNREIWVCDGDGTNARQLTTFGGPATAAPYWSPDGRKICFICRPEGNADVYVINSEGGSPVRLTTDPGGDAWPSWSRDGKWIYFRSLRSGESQIWKIPANGGQAVQVTEDGGSYAVESVDGQYLYFAQGVNRTSLWRMSIQGGEKSLVLDGVQSGFRFTVTKEGIYFDSELGFRSDDGIHFFDFVSGVVTPTTVYASGRPSISPDGLWILYAKQEEIESDIMLVENFR
jgi:Tol biopolymer transport system component